MKNLTILALSMSLVVVVSMSSCRKCTSCVVINAKDGSIDKVYPEYCGSSSNVTNYENSAKASYSNSGDKFVTCTRK